MSINFGRKLEHIEVRIEAKEKASISKEAEDKFEKMMGDDFLDHSPLYKDIIVDEIKNIEHKFNR